jgi:hypothetical protein
MMKFPFAAAVGLFLASAAICSANDHLKHFNHFSSGTFKGSKPGHHNLSGQATVRGVYLDGELTITITADMPFELINAQHPEGEWRSVITFAAGSGRLDLHHSFPFDKSYVQTSGPYRASTGELIANELFGIHDSAHDPVRGILHVKRNHGKFELLLHVHQGDKRYTFEYTGN